MGLRGANVLEWEKLNEGNTFPGQGSWFVGYDLSDALPACKAVFERAMKRLDMI